MSGAVGLSREVSISTADDLRKLRGMIARSLAFVAVLKGEDLVFDYANAPFFDLIGRREIVGQRLDEALPEVGLHLADRLRHVLRTGDSWTGDFPCPLRQRENDSPEIRSLFLSLQPMVERDGTLSGVEWHGIDVTEERRRAATLAFLRELTDAFIDLRDPSEIIATAERMLGEYLGTSRCAYAEVEADEETFTILADWSPRLPSSVGVYPLSAFGPRAVAEMRSGRTLVVHDVDRELALDEGAVTFNSIGIKAIVCCSLVKQGRLAAMMAVHQDRPRDWRPDEIELVQQVIARLAAEIERARSEAALRKSETRFRAVFDQAPDDAIVLLNPDRTIVAWSPAAERLTGWSADEAIGQRTDVLFSPEDRSAGVPEREVLVASQEGKSVLEGWRYRKNGTRFWGTGTVSALASSDGTSVQGFLKVFRDTTARRRELTSLAFLRDLNDAIVDLRDPERIMIVGERMLGEYYEASLCSFGEIAKDDDTVQVLQAWTAAGLNLVGTSSLSAYGPQAVAMLQEGRALVIPSVAREVPYGIPVEVFKMTLLQSAIAVPVVKGGRLIAVLAIGHSTSRDWSPDEVELVRQVADRLASEVERTRSADELQALNEDLEARVAERTADLVAKNQELERFSYSVSHDLRTPLRAIVANASIVMEEEGANLSEDGREGLVRLAAAANKMGRLVDDLLRYARLGVREVRCEPVDLSELVREVGEEVARERGECELTLSVESGLSVEGDPTLLGLIVRNLLDNACKYRKPGKPAQAEFRSELSEGRRTFMLRDHGIGFDMRYVSKLFRVFERLHRDEEVAGTGIGLANVARAIDRMGGRVWAEGEPGVGATFWFTLP